MLISAEGKSDFQNRLLSWFEKEQRDYLPWRSTNNPYCVLVAEKLLQQTSARQLVVDAYNELMRLYPTPLHLADADASELKKLIRSLGFMYRADELKAMAKVLVETHEGKVPAEMQELLALPGIGQYCARAVLSFAYRQHVPIVDTNVARFLYRLYGLSEPLPSSPASSKRLIKMAGELLPQGYAREFNLAVLDLCAGVCKRTNPLCPTCPVLSYCSYGQARVGSGGPTES